MLEAQQLGTSTAVVPEHEALVRKRDGETVPFDRYRIYRAIENAFRAELEVPREESIATQLSDQLRRITDEVVAQVSEEALSSEGVHVEKVQDVVEMKLMQFGYYGVARRYIVYREEHRKARQLRGEADDASYEGPEISVLGPNGSPQALDWKSLNQQIHSACQGLDACSADELMDELARTLYNNMSEEELDRANILAARTKIELDPEYAKVAARLLLEKIYREVFGQGASRENRDQLYRTLFSDYLDFGISRELISPQLKEFNIDQLAAAIDPERDDLFLYMGLQNIYDRYLLHSEKRRFEAPQFFWMRVSMGLASLEKQKEEKAIEFYNVLSNFRFVSSTPTLFNSGTLHPQLSSCYLSTIEDDLAHIYKVVSDNAQLSKWAGGIGNDWTNVRATGARIKGTNGESQGVIPFLKVANDTAIAVNQGGKRKGAICAYLETWHLEVEEFLELRKNTGDDRRRTHDMNTANWIPDLFLKRVQNDGTWTLFSPDDVPDLHDLYGRAFEKRYEEYEQMLEEGKIKLFKKVSATELWRKMLSMLFETGHPWITFKDPSNIRSPQTHTGVVHSSNLCTEILLNTSPEETAVCNLGSINLVAHTTSAGIDEELLAQTVRTAVRMLDNVIDINYYPTVEAKNSNHRHRPVGLGLMGFQDALYIRRISYASEEDLSICRQEHGIN